MLANGIHETATPGGALEVTLTAGTDDGDIRISDHFSVGQTIQYVMKSSTASNDDWEEGYGTVVTGNKFNRDLPTATYDGTTYDNSSPSRLTFTTACDVWITPVGNGVQTTGWWGNWPGASGDFIEMNGDAAATDAGSTHSPAKGDLIIMPFRKKSANDVKGLHWYQRDAMSGGEGIECYFFDAAPGGGPGQLLGTVTTAADPGAGTHLQVFDGSVIVSAPPGEYFVGFIWDKATGSPTVRGRESRVSQSLGRNATNSHAVLYQNFSTWALGDGLPTITSLSVTASNTSTVDIGLWLVR